MSRKAAWKLKYPKNWKKVSLTIRRVVGCCEKCGSNERLSVHHLGIPYVNGNIPSDKHDLRRENLQSLCWSCHEKEDNLLHIRHKVQERAAKKREKLEKHRALGIGVGLMHLTGGRNV